MSSTLFIGLSQVESQLAVKCSLYERQLVEADELTRRLKADIEKHGKEKSEIANQLEEEKRLVLTFQRFIKFVHFTREQNLCNVYLHVTCIFDGVCILSSNSKYINNLQY